MIELQLWLFCLLLVIAWAGVGMAVMVAWHARYHVEWGNAWDNWWDLLIVVVLWPMVIIYFFFHRP